MRELIDLICHRLERYLFWSAIALITGLSMGAATARAQGAGGTLTSGQNRTNVYYMTSAIWQDGGEGDHLVWSLPEGAFKARARMLGRRGFQLIDIESEAVKDQQRFSGLWRRQEDETRFFTGLTRTKLRSTMRRQARGGFQLIDIEPWNNNGSIARFDAIFAARQGTHQLELDLSLREMQARHAELSSQGLQMIDLETRLGPDSTRRYTAIWHPGLGSQRVHFDLEKPSFNRQQQGADRDGLLLEDIEVYYVEDDPDPHFAAIWTAGEGSYWLLTEAPKKVLLDRRQDLRQQDRDLFLIDLEVRRVEVPGDINQPPPAHDAGSSVPTPPPDNSGG